MAYSSFIKSEKEARIKLLCLYLFFCSHVCTAYQSLTPDPNSQPVSRIIRISYVTRSNQLLNKRRAATAFSIEYYPWQCFSKWCVTVVTPPKKIIIIIIIKNVPISRSPDRLFRNSRAPKSGFRLILCTSGTSGDGFRSPKQSCVVK